MAWVRGYSSVYLWGYCIQGAFEQENLGRVNWLQLAGNLIVGF